MVCIMDSVARGFVLGVLILGAWFAVPAAAAERDCTGFAAGHQEINISSGVYSERAVAMVPLKIEVPTGTDGGMDEACLEAEGRGTGSRVTAEFERAEACRQSARGVRIVDEARAPSPRIGGGFDAAAYEACMRGGEIEVEVLKGE